jgi:hypothetical protein
MTVMGPLTLTLVCQDRPTEIFVSCEEGGELEKAAREYEIAGKGARGKSEW